MKFYCVAVVTLQCLVIGGLYKRDEAFSESIVKEVL